VYCYVSSC